jgi:uncharacterized protein with PIN domain
MSIPRKMKTVTTSRLRCPACGNESRFIQFMERVENVVDGDGNHLHMILGIPDFYACYKCDERFYWGDSN